MKSSSAAVAADRRTGTLGTTLRTLIGSGDRIGRALLPFMVVGVALNIMRPAIFSVGGPSAVLRTASIVALVPGIVVWIWSAVLILTMVPKGELITTGPFALVRHPLYTAVALLVLPWAGFLLDTWLGALLGIVLYAASRRYSIEEERALSEAFGEQWDRYRASVKMPWL